MKQQGFDIFQKIFLLSLASLTYFPSIGITGLGINFIFLLLRFKRFALNSSTRNGLLLTSGLMIFSACFAENRGEAFLQLANFLPFFVWFGLLPWLLRRIDCLEKVAIALLPLI
jgi:hypothetical protein